MYFFFFITQKYAIFRLFTPFLLQFSSFSLPLNLFSSCSLTFHFFSKGFLKIPKNLFVYFLLQAYLFGCLLTYIFIVLTIMLLKKENIFQVIAANTCEGEHFKNLKHVISVEIYEELYFGFHCNACVSSQPARGMRTPG